MRNTIITLSLLGLVACGDGRPSFQGTTEDMARARAEAVQFGAEADTFLAAVNSIDGCPRGTRPTGKLIGNRADGAISNVNGRVGYTMSASGGTENACQ